MQFKENRLVNYLKAAKTELRKVTWPTRKDTIKFTFIVIGISLFVAAFLGGLDFLFSWLLSLVIS
jgi:preprotein translocase subunit SecE